MGKMQRDLRMGVFATMVVACMLFSTLSPLITTWNDDYSYAAVDDREDFLYVSLGDSITNGYGMEGYYKEGDDVNYAGFLQEAPYAYPSLIRDRLSEDYDVNLVQLAISGSRSAELRHLLDASFEGDSYLDRFGSFEDSLDYLKKYYDGEDIDIPKEYESLYEYYGDMISQADLITYNFGVNDFGTFIAGAIGNKLGISTGPEKYSNLSFDIYLGEEYSDLIEDFRSYFIELLTEELPNYGLSDELAPTFADLIDCIAFTFAYGIVGFIVNFDATMGLIYSMNPDVDVVVVDIYNAIDGVELAFDDFVVPLGTLYGALIEFINAYTTYLSPYSVKYAHTDLDSIPETFFDELKSGSIVSLDVKTAVVDKFGLRDVVKSMLIEDDYSEDVAEEMVKDTEYVYDFMDGENGKVTGLLMEISNDESVDVYSILGKDVDMDAVADSIRAYLVDDEPIDEGTISLAHIFLRALLDSGLFAHPNKVGHEQFADAIWDAYCSSDEPTVGWLALYEGYLTGKMPVLKEYLPYVLNGVVSGAMDLIDDIEALVIDIGSDLPEFSGDITEIIPLLENARVALDNDLSEAYSILCSSMSLTQAMEAIDPCGILDILCADLEASDSDVAGQLLAYIDSGAYASVQRSYDIALEGVTFVETMIKSLFVYDDSDDSYYESDGILYLGSKFNDMLPNTPLTSVRLMDIVEFLGGRGSDGSVSMNKAKVTQSELLEKISRTNLIVFEADSGNINQVISDLPILYSGNSVDLDFYQYSEVITEDMAFIINDIERILEPVMTEVFEKYPGIGDMKGLLYSLAKRVIYNQLGTFIAMQDLVGIVKEHNPSATVMFTGMVNILDGLYVTIDDESLDVGEYYGMLVRVCNIMFAEYCERTPGVLYVDVTDAGDGIIVKVGLSDRALIVNAISSKMNFDADNLRSQVGAVIAGMECIDLCTVTWKNYDGTVLQVNTNVGNVDSAAYTGDLPVKSMSDDYRYEFSGWSEPVYDSDDNVTFMAEFDTIERKQSIPVSEGEDSVTFDASDVDREFAVVESESWDIIIPSVLFEGHDTVNVSLRALDGNDLTEDLRSVVDGRQVISLELYLDGERRSDFNGNVVTVSVNYVLGDGEDASNIAVWYVNEERMILEVCKNVTFDVSSNRVVFDTTHFSYWALGHEESEDSDGGSNSLVFIIGGIVLAAVFCAVLVRMKR